MKRTLFVAAAAVVLSSGCGLHPTQVLRGSGSTFVHPIMDKWTDEYQKKGVTVEYEAVGSGVGMQRFAGGIFDFGCTDAPMSEEQQAKAKEVGGEIFHLPLVLGAVVPAYNLEEVKEPLTFSGSVLAEIYLGKITKWNDKPIQDLNPGVNLPSQEIMVVHRDEPSGTTFIWTDYLTKSSPEWKKDPSRVGTSINWPVGEGRTGNDGVAAKIKETPNSLGYVTLNHALKNKLAFARVQNSTSKPTDKGVEANLESVTAAAEAALDKIPEDLCYSLANAPGEKSYPISGTTWAVVFVNQPRGKGQAVVDFLRWATTDGQEFARELDYAPLPKGLAERVQKKIDQITVAK